MGQTTGRLHPQREAGRKLVPPLAEASIPGPAVEARVQLDGVELLGVTLQTCPSAHARLVEHALPMVIRPSGCAHLNYHRPEVPVDRKTKAQAAPRFSH